ncbi:MAG: hypothetical protein Q8N34_03335 [Gammaproteobacteria bacterium]|nr:hypothetical protein [Gammaproteobacteria bacterium]
MAYQGAAGGLGAVASTIRPELMIVPPIDHLIVLDAPLESLKKRPRGRRDRIERRPPEYFEKARTEFSRAATHCRRSIQIDATQSPGDVFAQAIDFLSVLTNYQPTEKGASHAHI